MEYFTIEEFENIRLLAGQKIETLKSVIKNYYNDKKISEAKRVKGVQDAEQEIEILRDINAKAMRAISNKMLR